MLLFIFIIFPYILFSNQEDDFNKSLDWVLELSKNIEILEEHPDLEKINNIGYTLASNLEDENLYSFQIINMKEANAFALPGGFIFITKGMLDLKLSDDAIASLLAHEIIHIKNKHSNKMEKRQALLSALSNILILGILFGVKDDVQNTNTPPWWSVPDSQWGKLGTYESKKENLLEGTIAFSVIFQELLMQGYSREFEMESDREGTYLLAKSGFSPTGTVELLDKLKSHYYEAPDLGYWRSHPYLEDRFELAKVRINQLRQASEKKDPISYQKKIQEKFYFLSLKEKNKEKSDILFKIALNSSSKGILSFELNLKELQKIEKKILSKNPYERNYKNLIKRYEKVIKKFENDPEVQFGLVKLKEKKNEILNEKNDCFLLFNNYFYESFPSTEYLFAYYENYKEESNDFYPFIFYASNLLRLGNEEKGVEIFKEIYEKVEKPFKAKILEEISIYLHNLKNLCAIYKIYENFPEKFIKENSKSLFFERLKKIDSLSDLRKYLDKFPNSAFYDIVFNKLDEIANKNYIKGRAFKSFGDYQSALEIYNKILENAYDTKIASKLRDELKEGGKL